MRAKSITKKSSFNPKATIVMLTIAIALVALSIVLFRQIDLLVHGELYQYGLQFSDKWAIAYWNASNAYHNALFITMASIGLAIAFLAFAKEKINMARNASYLLLTTATVGNFVAIYFFTRIDYIINNNLYSYGLEFNNNWASVYWNYSATIQIILAFSIVLTAGGIIRLLASSAKKTRINLPQIAGWSIAGTGVVILIMASIFEAQVPGLIGLGLIFWGILFIYIRGGEYIKKSLFDATTTSQQLTLDQILPTLKLKGKPIYLSPKYSSNPNISKVYIPKQKDANLPPEVTQQNAPLRTYQANPSGIIINPPGAGLTNLFEKTLETSFTHVDLQFLLQKMPKLFSENLEICQNLEIRVEEDKIHLIITGSIITVGVNTAEREYEHSDLISPLVSAIACSIAKATGYPIRAENLVSSNDGKDISIEYTVLIEDALT